MSQASLNAQKTLAAEAEAVLSSLCELLDRETDAVRSADFTTFRSIQADKHAMLARYRSLMETINKQNLTAATASEEVAARLKAIVTRFHDTAERNTKALEAGRNSIQRITDRIIKGARESVTANRTAYNYQGHASLNTKSPLSIKVDEVL